MTHLVEKSFVEAVIISKKRVTWSVFEIGYRVNNKAY
jgi:hypothetical protein